MVELSAIYDAPRSGRPREISALERVSIEQLACSEPSGVGLEMTHWSTRSLAKIAMKRGLVSHIAHSTVSLILRNADLQPHRSRYWITPTLNPDFLQQAGRILWLYERTETLQAQDEIALALDEKPNIQALQRTHPTQPMRPGQIERQEFEYERHGVVNFLGLAQHLQWKNAQLLFGQKRQRTSLPSSACFVTTISLLATCAPHLGWRSQSHLRRHCIIFAISLWFMVASLVYTSPFFLAQSSRNLVEKF